MMKNWAYGAECGRKDFEARTHAGVAEGEAMVNKALPLLAALGPAGILAGAAAFLFYKTMFPVFEKIGKMFVSGPEIWLKDEDFVAVKNGVERLARYGVFAPTPSVGQDDYPGLYKITLSELLSQLEWAYPADVLENAKNLAWVTKEAMALPVYVGAAMTGSPAAASLFAAINSWAIATGHTDEVALADAAKINEAYDDAGARLMKEWIEAKSKGIDREAFIRSLNWQKWRMATLYRLDKYMTMVNSLSNGGDGLYLITTAPKGPVPADAHFSPLDLPTGGDKS